MKKFLYVVISVCVFLNNIGCSSIKSSSLTEQIVECKYKVDPISNLKIYDFVHVLPSFPGGDVAMINYFQSHFNYPVTDLNFKGSFLINGFVKTDGKVVINQINNHSKEEYSVLEMQIDTIFSSMPKWIPGKCNNIDVNSRLYTILRF